MAAAVTRGAWNGSPSDLKAKLWECCLSRSRQKAEQERCKAVAELFSGRVAPTSNRATKGQTDFIS